MNLNIAKAPPILNKPNAVFLTYTAVLPAKMINDTTQVIQFGTGLEFFHDGILASESTPSTVVLPCLFGAQLEGPLLLATGKVPQNVPFSDQVIMHSEESPGGWTREYTHNKCAQGRDLTTSNAPFV